MITNKRLLEIGYLKLDYWIITESMISPIKVWRNQKHIRELLGKQGKIVSYTVIRVAPAGFSTQAPYPVIIVALTDNTKVIGQLVDWQVQHLKGGQRVEAVVRRIYTSDSSGIIPYGIKFKPV